MAELTPEAVKLIDAQVTAVLSEIVGDSEAVPKRLLLERYINSQVEKRLKVLAIQVFGTTVVSLALIAAISLNAIQTVTSQMKDYASETAKRSINDVLAVSNIPATIADASILTAQKSAETVAKLQEQTSKIQKDQEIVSQILAAQTEETKRIGSLLDSVKDLDATKLAGQAKQLEVLLKENDNAGKLTQLLERMATNLEVNTLTAKSIKSDNLETASATTSIGGKLKVTDIEIAGKITLPKTPTSESEMMLSNEGLTIVKGQDSTHVKPANVMVKRDTLKLSAELFIDEKLSSGRTHGGLRVGYFVNGKDMSRTLSRREDGHPYRALVDEPQ